MRIINSSRIGELLDWGTDQLKQAKVPEPALEAQLLLSQILRLKKLDLFLKKEKEVAKKDLTCFRKYIVLRRQRIPASYILKNTQFYGLDLFVDKGALIPRPETELLVEEIINIVGGRRTAEGRKNIKILEIGVGSGAIVVALAKNLNQAAITGTDTSAKALRIARKNIKKHKVETHVKLIRGSLFAKLKEKFDYIVSNPPYVKAKDFSLLQPEVGYEPKAALYGGKDGLDFYRKIISQARYYLQPGGLLAFEIGYGQARKIRQLLEKEQLFSSIEIKKDYSGIERIILAKSHE
ncbi:MAG: peptide chain release factor N(5)-glutamine methyltransferase [bacterium]|nr:peptide chain release factor N(5)-glutamine methyltransferase [bacterium]MDD5353994.1 peptide chain release factor N(5)-glutamine methyltransferase [bacterium]MDD5756131.1 peptide chain release factor N(5)-glutamine methyltransferase [bacterium]